jgi:hypothetical protein
MNVSDLMAGHVFRSVQLDFRTLTNFDGKYMQ